MRIDELRDRVCAAYPELCPLFSIEFGDGTMAVTLGSLHDAASSLKQLGFERLGMVTAVDKGDVFTMVYRLQSMSLAAGMFLKCDVPRADARVPSMCDLWPAANWQEREVFDLFGIRFEGHPNLTRILLPDDWHGYPLRKDYQDEHVIKRPDYI